MGGQRCTILRGRSVAPDSVEGREVFAGLLGCEADDVESFGSELPAGGSRDRHWHSGAIVAAVVAGDLEMVFDDGERHRLGPGDWIRVGPGVPHDEHSDSGVSLVIGHTEPFDNVSPTPPGGP